MGSRAILTAFLALVAVTLAGAVGTFKTQRVWPQERTVGWMSHPYIGMLTSVGESGAIQNADTNWYRFDCDTVANEAVGDITVDLAPSGADPSMVLATPGVYFVMLNGTFVVKTGVQFRWEVAVFANTSGNTPATDQAGDPGTRVATAEVNVMVNTNRSSHMAGFGELTTTTSGDELSVWARSGDTTLNAEITCYGWDWRVERWRRSQ